MITIFISWLGNSSFLIKTSLGKRLLIDPINKFHSCNLTNFYPNIITLSSENFKCNCLKTLPPNVKLLTHTGIFESEIGMINCISSFNDNLNGLKRGKNKIFIYNIDDLKICHLGYLGHILNEDALEILRNCDILFLPIGGNINLDGKTAYKLAKLINPKIIIPMNYKFNPYSFLFDGPQDFLMLNKNIVKLDSEIFLINKESLSNFKDSTVILLNPVNNTTI